ncbi:MAG: PASTA domain-containing protein [Myxococcales bacterium]|nr:PASTA domain-containing protein [Myxococcales bacterium]
MNDSFKMFLIALVTAVASQLLLGPYILKLQGFVPASEQAAQGRVTKLEQGARPAAAPAPATKLNAPNLEGMSVDAARERWRDKGLEIIEDGEKIDSSAEPGSIIEQRPAAGSPLASMEIRVTVAKATPETEVPSVVGQSLEEARKTLEGAGFQVPEPTSEPSREPKGTVIKQLPAAGEQVKAESIVRLVIAEAPAVKVPKVTGTRLPKARKLLEAAGLAVGSIRRVEHEERGEDYVLRQSPDPGAEVPPGTEVELVVVAPN